MTFKWSMKPFWIGLLYAFLVCFMAYFFRLSMALPWQPVSVIGIAVAFYLGFKNNSSYDRTWEARKIWGSIVNNSRSFGAAVCAFVQGDNAEEIRRELIYRHIAWLTALRHQLRLGRPWEHKDERLNKIYAPTICEDYNTRLRSELNDYLEPPESEALWSNSNMATQILKNQSIRLQSLRDNNHFEDFRHMEFHALIRTFYDDQGKSERIKNFPFPRQYASTALWLTFVFCIIVPFGLLDAFSSSGIGMLAVCPLTSAVVIWIFFLMEKIGDYSENPFEGTYNDVPITSIARAIEIDMREMIADTDIPEPVTDINGFLM